VSVAVRIIRLMSRQPKRRMLAVAVCPDLAEEFLSFVEEPRRRFDELTAGSGIRCRWRCRACGYEWDAAVVSRVQGGGCRPCSYRQRGRARSTPLPGGSFDEMYPHLVGEFRGNFDRPGVDLTQMRPAVGDRCRWSAHGACVNG
jgi:hypothetical protein